LLSTVAESLERPGPYEAPERSKDWDADAPHWAVLELGGGVVERRAYSLRGGTGTELAALIDRLRGLAKQDKLAGLLVRVEPLGISLPDAVELRAAMHALRDAGKPIACHAEAASNATYLVLAACSRIGVAPVGQVTLSGPAAMPIHVRPLLDKLGIQADFLHVGAYKGAAEPLTRDAPSKEMEETLGAILDQRYQTMVDIVANDRGLAPAAVKGLIDTGLFSSEQAKAEQLVDDVMSFEAFRDAVVKAPWTRLRLSESLTQDKLATGLKLLRFVGAAAPDRPAGDHVALVYAVGDIVDGDGEGVLGARQQIASHTLVAALRELAADAAVKGVVLRIDSGGGSAQASELIWQAVAALKATKPVVVSMSDVAASGGYYIAAGATKIFAHPDTLTGSIGVVGGKLAPGGGLARLGVRAFPMGRGKHATMMASLTPWTDDERALIQRSMEDVYRTFVGRVAAGRGKTPEQIQPIAQGRVWTGARAKALGLVDELGGLDAAVAEAKRLAGVDAASELEVYPPPPTLRDFLHGLGGMADLPFGADAALTATAAADPALADAARSLLELALSFRATPVQAVAVLPAIR
ncbi:MAG TPA: signal peptide peptidase SppA, partial [Kofleriaceae bacterium]|nr:signal peptide peptidase SppA [Kofleriaceae bacterium]